MLESASAASHNDDRDTQRNRSAAEQYMRQRKEQNLGDRVVAPPTATASDTSLNYTPRIPEWLNHARAQEIPPGVPALPRGNIYQAPCPTVSTMPAPQLAPGLASRSAQLMPTTNPLHFEGAVPSALGLFNPPAHNPAMNNNFGTTSMYYARAKGGSRGTRIPFQPDYDHYERAAGKRLPFPDISNLLRNENVPLI